MIIEGPAGIGKSSLLRAGRSRIEEAGLAPLLARGAELERDFAFGAARQLFESPARSGAAELFDGPAALAAPLLGAHAPPGAMPAPSSEEAGHAVVHGLYWLTVNLARRRPLALLIDDAHWVDAPSLRLVAYLAGRLERLPVLIVVATRAGEGGVPPWLDALARAPESTVLRPAPLSAAAVARLMRSELPGAEARTCRACHEATAGNPLFLHEVIGALQRADPSQSAGVLQRLPAGMRDAVAAHVARLPGAARALARAAAVLGPDSLLRHCAAVGSLAPDAAAGAADRLAEAGVLAPGRPLRFVHPIIRAAVLDGIAPAARAAAHARAVELLDGEGAPAERVAAHLLAADARGDARACRLLRDAAGEALARGAPETAVRYLRRALQEPPLAAERPALLLELGRAEALAFEPAAAVDHLRRGIATSTDPDARLRAALIAGTLLMSGDGLVEGVASMDEALARAACADRALIADVEGRLAHFARSDPGAWRIVAGRLEDLYRRVEAGSARAPSQLAALAAAYAMRGAPASTVTELALRAIAARGASRPAVGDFTIVIAARCLIAADRLDDAAAALDAAIAGLRAQGAGRMAFPLDVFRAEVLLRRGDLAGAETVARELLAQCADWPMGVPAALSVLAAVLVEREQPDEALTLIAEHEYGGATVSLPSHYTATMVLHARGAARVAAGDARAGLDDLLACGERLVAIDEPNPALLCWRSDAAGALAILGDRVGAASLAAEELALARKFGAPRAISIALRSVAAAGPASDAVDRLREAAAVTRGSPAVLEHARALAALGAAELAAGGMAVSVGGLEQALEIAERCEATRLRSRALAALASAGRRPRRGARSGPAALTRAERRAARLAAEGLSNKQIAERLVVTLRTVEFHLTGAYRKLGVAGRAGLPAALEPRGARDGAGGVDAAAARAGAGRAVAPGARIVASDRSSDRVCSPPDDSDTG